MNLTDHFLIAMPSMKDQNFTRTVIYLCEHNDDGAMGLVINAPIGINIGNMLQQIDVQPVHPQICTKSLQNPVLNGGPVATDCGFILHQLKDDYQSSIEINQHLAVTTSKDILTVLGTEAEPKQYLVTLGYSGWSAGQLEQELLDNVWLTTPADPSIIFDTPPALRWKKAVQSLGIDTAQLSIDSGHA
ncbi:YqgE/AlgH family protein [Vibrio sp. S17_S38]|uniref:YqgE/AlgH family protein n=1 Tax=Vibrio sp. S17_S38 TaxID=2720229 RepID=UPI001681802B|nr:YqgE/AlgH family protein [Vibrio sp. S17_S38]MBD1572440.1 YqgE/AlgH family protein [Vibrio sp. S17_S38]